jgi:hypothetical protein
LLCFCIQAQVVEKRRLRIAVVGVETGVSGSSDIQWSSLEMDTTRELLVFIGTHWNPVNEHWINTGCKHQPVPNNADQPFDSSACITERKKSVIAVEAVDRRWVA